MDALGGGIGAKTRELVDKAFRERGRMAFNVARLTVVGRKLKA